MVFGLGLVVSIVQSRRGQGGSAQRWIGPAIVLGGLAIYVASLVIWFSGLS